MPPVEHRLPQGALSIYTQDVMEKVTSKSGNESYWFWCPGCDTHHAYTTRLGDGEKGPCWKMSGTLDKPTFTPSLRCRGSILCHLFVTDGMVRYLSDCEHALAGQIIPLEDARFGCA